MRRLISVQEAQQRVLDRAAALPAVEIGTHEAAGRVLACHVVARWDLPSRDLSIMDGWAVRSADLQRHGAAEIIELEPSTESAAGHPSTVAVEAGRAARISTGAVIPEGADCVVAQEEATCAGDVLRIDPKILDDIVPGRFIRARGSDIAKGQRVLGEGSLLRPGSIAAIAACGHERVHVHGQPRVAILGTGDELVPIGRVPLPGQVVSSNGIMLAASIRAAGGVPVDLGDVGDDVTRLDAVLRRGLEADVLVTSGGISVGKHDLVHAALERLGAQTLFRGVALQPGKPTTFLATKRCLVFALPGNPASSLVAFELFVRPALRRMAGWSGDPRRPPIEVRLLAPAKGSSSREHYVRARRDGDGAWPASSQLSGNLRSIADFDLLLRIPAGTLELATGTRCEALEVT